MCLLPPSAATLALDLSIPPGSADPRRRSEACYLLRCSQPLVAPSGPAHFGSYRKPMGVGVLPYLPPDQHAALPASEDVAAVTGYSSSTPLFFGRLTRGTGAKMFRRSRSASPYAGILTGAGTGVRLIAL